MAQKQTSYPNDSIVLALAKRIAQTRIIHLEREGRRKPTEKDLPFDISFVALRFLPTYKEIARLKIFPAKGFERLPRIRCPIVY